MLFLVLIFVKKWKNYTRKSKKSLEKFCGFGKSVYLCTRFQRWRHFKKEFFDRFT